jgi:beta-galactosidase
VGKKGDQVVASDQVITAGDPAKIQLTADRSTIQADGADLSYITVKITDESGNLCPDANDELEFEVTGAGTLEGLDNGDPTNHESFKGTRHAAFHGLSLAVVRAKDSAGTAFVTVRSKSLGESKITLITTK